MKVSVRNDSVEIEGYVNAIERNSKPLHSRIGRFIERVCKGAFSKALKRNDDVLLLLNHDPSRVLGSTKQGNLELEEDNIGLHARATITAKEVVDKARHGDLVGWSFGFTDLDVETGVDEENHLPLRKVRDLNLGEVSILDRTRSPAYDGTLVSVRDDTDELMFRGEAMISESVDLSVEERNEPQQEETPAEDKPIDYDEWEEMINEMRGY
jgi:HK97 family phage prohead protease